MSKTILEHSIKLCIRKKTQVTYDGKSRLKKMKTTYEIHIKLSKVDANVRHLKNHFLDELLNDFHRLSSPQMSA